MAREVTVPPNFLFVVASLPSGEVEIVQCLRVPAILASGSGGGRGGGGCFCGQAYEAWWTGFGIRVRAFKGVLSGKWQLKTYRRMEVTRDGVSVPREKDFEIEAI
jgi:hypothetical protein